MTVDLERGLIGLALNNRENLYDLGVNPDDFADLRHAAIWRLMVTMDKAGEPTDVPTMATAYKRIPKEERTGIDHTFFADCWAARPVASLGEKHAATIADEADRRRLDDALIRGRQLIEAQMPAAEVAEIIRGEVEAANRATAKANPIGQIVHRVLDSLENPSPALPTPWDDLNEKITGWRPGALYVVGARPGVGKSIVALQAGIDLAARGGWVAFHSLEMPEEEVVTRAIAQMAEVPLGRLQGKSENTTPLNDQDWQHISATLPKITGLPLSIDDRATVTVTDIRSHARTLSRRPEGLAGIVVDYLQLMSAPRGDRRPRHEIVADFSRSLKLLAKEMGCPVIALSQLNRASEARQDKRPVLADLRESGAVEQDADVVLLLHTDDEKSTDMDMLVAKNRHGVVGPVRLTKEGHYARAVPRAWKPRIPTAPAHHHYPDN